MKSILTIIAIWGLTSMSYAQQWLTVGNAINDPNVEFFGTTSAQDIIIKTNNTEAMRILSSNGNVGIGTNAPANKLQVSGGAGSGVRLQNMTSALSLGTDANGDIIANNFAIYAIGDVKYAMLSTDHSGWYKMDGLDYSTHGLTATAITNANSLGFSGNLPNATDKYLSQVTAGSLGDDSGNALNKITLNRNQLPNFTLTGTTGDNNAKHTHTGTTNNDGSHTHTYLRANQNAQGQNGGDDFMSNVLITDTTTADGSIHTHGFTTNQETQTHKHTFETVNVNPDTQVDINIQPATLKANAFVYLGM